MADTETSWTWNLPGTTTSSKVLGRPFLSKDTAWDLIGVDGNAVDAIKTHPGFRRVDAFDVLGTSPSLVNVFPVTLLLNATSSVSGYVLVVEDAGATKFYFRFKSSSGWIYAHSSQAIWTINATNLEVDVQVLGKYLFTFARGHTPQLHYSDATSTTSSITFVSANAGPSTAPNGEVVAGRTDSTLAFGASTKDFLVCETTNTTSKALLNGGRYAFAVQYMDSATGRKTPLSKPVEVTLGMSTIVVAGGTNIPAAQNPSKVNRGMLYAVKYKAGYDKALIYRSVNQGATNPSIAGAPLQLETILTWNSGDAANKESQSVQNTDRVLVYKDVYVDRGNLLPTLPAAGIAQFLEGTMFVSRISGAVTVPGESTPQSPPAGVGELRWSSTTEILPENFGPFNRWVPPTPANEVIGMRRVGNFMLGFSSDRIYHFRRQGATVRVEEMHPGYGLAARYGMESVANVVYFATTQGLKAVSSEGQLDDVKGLDWLFQSKLSEVSNLQLSYDAKGLCLHVMWKSPGTTPNPDGHMAILWFATSRMTELVDIPFKFVRTGDVPNASGSTDRRSMFFKPQNDARTKWAFFVADYDKQGTRGTNLVQNTSIYSGASLSFGPVASLQNYLTVTNEANFYTNYPSFGDFVGTALYSVGPTVGYSYLHYRVNEYQLRQDYVASGQTVTDFLTDSYSELLANNQPVYVSRAPVKFQWTGSNFGYDPGATGADIRDFFRSKQVSGMRAYVRTNEKVVLGVPTLASWNSSGVVPTIAFQLYRDTEDAPSAQSIPIHRDGSPTPTLLNDGDRDRMDGASFGQGTPGALGKKHGIAYASLSPSVMCVWPMVTINLLALSVKGKILDSDRRYV